MYSKKKKLFPIQSPLYCCYNWFEIFIILQVFFFLSKKMNSYKQWLLKFYAILYRVVTMKTLKIEKKSSCCCCELWNISKRWDLQRTPFGKVVNKNTTTQEHLLTSEFALSSGYCRLFCMFLFSLYTVHHNYHSLLQAPDIGCYFSL